MGDPMMTCPGCGHKFHSRRESCGEVSSSGVCQCIHGRRCNACGAGDHETGACKPSANITIAGYDCLRCGVKDVSLKEHRCPINVEELNAALAKMVQALSPAFAAFVEAATKLNEGIGRLAKELDRAVEAGREARG